jgi:hypothetical protein
MRFSADRVSVSQNGDYFQLSLEAASSEKQTIDEESLNGPYLIVQRSFEMPDNGLCYVETHDSDYCGHFRLRLNEFSSSRLAFEIERKEKKHVEVSFALGATEFEKVLPTVKVIFSD